MVVFILLIAQLWIFAGITLGLHYLRPRFGLMPLLFYVAGIVAILNFVELLGLSAEPYPGIVIRIGAHIFVPVILLTVLLLYITEGTHIAQLVIAGLIGVDLLVLLVLFVILLSLNVIDNRVLTSGIMAQQGVVTVQFLRGVFASIFAFFVNMLVIAIFYQGVRNLFAVVPVWLAASAALMAALWTDSILYNLLSNFGTATFQLWLPGDVFAKTLSALMIGPLMAWYLTRIVPHTTTQDHTRRPALDILFGAFGNLRASLKTLQGELRENRLTYQQLTDNIDEVFWLATVGSGRIEYISPAFERITGYAREKFYEEPDALVKILHEDDQQRMPEGIIKYIYTVDDDEFRLRRKDGEIRWVRNRVFPIHNEVGEVYRIAGIIEDITERKQIADQEFALALEREKVQMMRDFVRDSSHDLKSPVAAILLRVYLLEHASDDAMRADHMQKLRSHVEQLSQMIDELFTLARLESPGALRPGATDLNQIARQVYETLRPVAEDKGLVCVLNLAEEASPIIGDADGLERVLINLLDNAIRYTAEGAITLDVFSDDDHVRVEVRDTGIGIGQEDLPQVFNRFYRSKIARSSGISGTGLGLAIVKTIVEGHQGTVDVASHPETGTTFTVQIPRTPPLDG